MSIAPILLCSDLDRTLLPNGLQPESPLARPLLRQLANRPELTLAYVSGRSLSLLQEAITRYQLPLPHYALCDVGSTIYQRDGDRWQLWQAWSDHIGSDWQGSEAAELMALLADLPALTPQEPEKQNRHKLSFYAAVDSDPQQLQTAVQSRLQAAQLHANTIWSVDETQSIGLLDILPQQANKLHAIQFLLLQRQFSRDRTLFAGDSGNDIPVLASPIPAILVANATAAVRDEACRLAQRSGQQERLYLAQGGYLGMNGNYSAGVLEGVAHYLPECAAWLQQAAQQLTPDA